MASFYAMLASGGFYKYSTLINLIERTESESVQFGSYSI